MCLPKRIPADAHGCNSRGRKVCQDASRNRNRNRKLEISTAPTKTKSREPAY